MSLENPHNCKTRIERLSDAAQVGDTRWRSAQSAGTEVIEGLLNSLQTYTDFLQQPDMDASSHGEATTPCLLQFHPPFFHSSIPACHGGLSQNGLK